MPTSATIESGLRAIRTSGSRPTAQEGRFPSRRTASAVPPLAPTFRRCGSPRTAPKADARQRLRNDLSGLSRPQRHRHLCRVRATLGEASALRTIRQLEPIGPMPARHRTRATRNHHSRGVRAPGRRATPDPAWRRNVVSATSTRDGHRLRERPAAAGTYPAMAGVDRVQERRRAAALARHYRDQEGLPVAEIARRLGRAQATVKAYLYDPSYANKGHYTSLGATRAVYGAPRAENRPGPQQDRTHAAMA